MFNLYLFHTSLAWCRCVSYMHLQEIQFVSNFINRTTCYWLLIHASWPHDVDNYPPCPQTILLSPEFSCTEEVLTIVSLLSVDSVLYNPPARREEVLAVRRKFITSEGDHMTLLNIYRAFKKVSGNKVSWFHISVRFAHSSLFTLYTHLSDMCYDNDCFFLVCM